MRGAVAGAILLALTVLAPGGVRADIPMEPDNRSAGPYPDYLEYDEACDAGPLKIGPVPEALRAELESRGAVLPRRSGLSWWDNYELLTLARARSLGLAGRLDRAEGRRLLCLSLRRDNDSMSAALLAREFAAAQGAGKRARSGIPGQADRPDLVRHFARVAAASLTPTAWRRRAPYMPFARGIDVEPMAQALDDASAWYAALDREPVPVRFRTALQYIHEAGVPKSDRIADHILSTIRYESPELGLFAVRRTLLVHRRKLDHPRWRIGFLDSLFMVAYVHRHPEGRVLVGSLYLEGDLLPHDPMHAYVWMRFGEREGADLGIDLDRLRASLTPYERAAAAELLERRHPPSFGPDISSPSEDL